MRPLLPEAGPDLLDLPETMAQMLLEEAYAVDTAAAGPVGLDKALTRDGRAIKELASGA